MPRRLALVAALAAGCADEPGTASQDPPAPPAAALAIRAAPFEVTLLAHGRPRLRLGRDGLQLGVVEAWDDALNYDPSYLETIEGGGAEPRLRWLSVTGGEADGEGGATLAFGAEHGARLSVEEREPGRYSLTLVPDDPPAGAWPVALYRIAAQVDPDEAFYGLGGVLDTPNHRGKRRAMQLDFDATSETFYNEAHVPVPLLVGTSGWGLFVEDPHPGLFEVATRTDDRVVATFGTGPDSPQGLTFHLYAADHPLDITRHYYETTGYPVLPARWALGPWVWRDENDDQAQAISDLETMRDLDLAATGYWIDRPYASGVNTFDFEPGKFPDPAALVATAHALGFRMALWHTPYLDPEQAADLHQEAATAGWFPPRHPPALNDWSTPLDFTSPEATAWWQGLLGRYVALGIEGFKLDYAEDVVVAGGGRRLAWEFADGTDERVQHSRYQLLYHQAYAAVLPETGGFLLCRAGTYGDQRYASVIWPGDLDATMNARGVRATDGDEVYSATGGLPASLVVGLSLGPSGFPFYGADTGGYRHAPPDRETFVRWFEQTALSTVMQVGTNSNDVAWELGGRNGFDAESLAWYRQYARLHLRLWPYEWTYARRLLQDGRPIQRAFGLAFPELGHHPADTYLFGDHLLVAPVLEHGAREREVPFPPGRWVSWFTGEVHDADPEAAGPTFVTVEAPLGRLPLFLAEGGIVPLLRPTIDTVAPTTQPERVDSYATTPGVLWPRVFAGPESRFDLFDGARLGQEDDGRAVRLSWVDGAELKEGALVELLAFPDAPAGVTVDGADAPRRDDPAALAAAAAPGWAYEPDQGGRVFVRLPPGEHTAEVTR